MQLCEVRRHAGCLTSQAPVARRKESSVKWNRKVTKENKRLYILRLTQYPLVAAIPCHVMNASGVVHAGQD
jgi:hypothetical protein